MLYEVVRFDIFHDDRSPIDASLRQPVNISVVSRTLIVFHFDKSPTEVRFEHK